MVTFSTLDVADQTLAVGGWVGGAIGLASTIVTAYLSYRTNRDRLQFDNEMRDLRHRVKDLEGDITRSTEAEQRATAAEALCRKEMAEVNVKMARAESKLEQMIAWMGSKGMPQPKTGPITIRRRADAPPDGDNHTPTVE